MFKRQACECLLPLIHSQIFLSKEAEHVEGFAKDVQLYSPRLMAKILTVPSLVDPSAKLEDELESSHIVNNHL